MQSLSRAISSRGAGFGLFGRDKSKFIPYEPTTVVYLKKILFKVLWFDDKIVLLSVSEKRLLALISSIRTS